MQSSLIRIEQGCNRRGLWWHSDDCGFTGPQGPAQKGSKSKSAHVFVDVRLQIQVLSLNFSLDGQGRWIILSHSSAFLSAFVDLAESTILNLELPFQIKYPYFHFVVPHISNKVCETGVPSVRSFVRVVLPIMLLGIISGAIIMWVTTLAELSTTIVLYCGPWATMTVEIFQRIGSDDFCPASSYATILIPSVLIPLFILNRVSGRDLASSL